jgi:hypothetical protein
MGEELFAPFRETWFEVSIRRYHDYAAKCGLKFK